MRIPDVPARFSRNTFLTPILFLVFGTIAYKICQYILNEDYKGISYVSLGCVAVAVIVVMLGNWRTGVYFFFTWLLFEDFARKFLGNNMAIFFLKDVLLLVVYLSFFVAYQRGKVQHIRPPFLVPVLLFVWLGIMQVFNPASGTIIYGILGVKLFFSYMPLFFVGYALLNSELELRQFFHINVWLGLTIASLGIAQSIIGPKFLNPELPSEEIRELSTLYRTSPITGAMAYRATSVFVSAGRYTNFLLLFWFIILAWTGFFLLRGKRDRKFTFLALMVLYSAIVLSAARGVFMWSAGGTIVFVAAYFRGAPLLQREKKRAFQMMRRAALGIVMAFVVLFLIFPDALASRLAIYSETLTPGSEKSELQQRTWQYPWDNFVAAFAYERWPYGYGIGTSSLGVQYVAKLFHAPPTGAKVESGFGSLVLELGILGLVLWFVMSGGILIAAWRVVKKLKGSPWFPIGFVIFFYAFLVLLPITFTGLATYQDFVVNAYLWLLLGILFRLPQLPLSKEFARVEPHSRFSHP